MTKFLIAVAAIAASPAWAAQDAGAPPGSPDTLYCMRVEAATGSRIETVECWTRAEWADAEVDVDADWAENGVRVIAA